MRKLFIAAALCAVALPALAGDHTAHPMRTASGWFDFENCAFCKHLVDDPGLLPHTTWTNHKIADGGLNITTVQPEYKAAMKKAGAAMEQLGQDMQSGKVNPMQVKMCGHCQAWGELMMAGVSIETVESDAADITLFTSDDPAVVARIHAVVDRNNEEMAMMMGTPDEDGAHAHGGHEHPKH